MAEPTPKSWPADAVILVAPPPAEAVIDPDEPIVLDRCRDCDAVVLVRRSSIKAVLALPQRRGRPVAFYCIACAMTYDVNSLDTLTDLCKPPPTAHPRPAMNALRPDLPPLPAKVAALPVDERGYPVPWFVAWVDGKPEFRCSDSAKFNRAIRERLCWVCGEKLGVRLAFVIGPMCALNRTTAEPPCHRACAEFSIAACPFLSKPQMHRRENDLPAAIVEAPGLMIRRNPGSTCLWVTRSYTTFREGRGVLIRLGEPDEVTWWKEGRTATRAEVVESIETGLPILREAAEAQSPEAVAHLETLHAAAQALLPKEAFHDA